MLWGLVVGCLACSGGGDEGDLLIDAGAFDWCARGCNTLETCGFCWDESCPTPGECADRCRFQDREPTGRCLAELSACDEAGISACFSAGASDDCYRACAHVDECGRALTDAAGNALDVEGCATQCRAEYDGVQVACLATAACTAEAIEGCVEPAPADDCEAACLHVDDCGLALTDANGDALDVAACADECRAEYDADTIDCLSAAACTEDGISDCFVEPPTACEQLCAEVLDCGSCVPGDDGECLDEEGCLAACDGAEDEAPFDCLGAAASCDAQRLCLEPPMPMDDCDAGCLWLDGCGLCIPDENDECLSVEGCAAACRDFEEGPIYACFATVEDCEDDAAIDACYAVVPDPTCETACAALVECGLDCRSEGCAPCGGEGEPACMADACTEACTVDGTADTFACFADACDLAGTDACVAPEDDTCTLGCYGLDECDYCFTDKNDDCIPVEQCVDECRSLDPVDRAVEFCVAGLAMCDDAAVEACFEAENDACAQACLLLEDCGLCALSQDGDCLTPHECAEACRTDDETLAACVNATAGCDDAALEACVAP
ncbi:MAG: hypothetical protein KC620_02465 [Myxococcales bacterium]|nr:hypothetical protein [Myxococcales bacterium]